MSYGLKCLPLTQRRAISFRRVPWLLLLTFCTPLPTNAATIFSEDFEGVTLTAGDPDYSGSATGWTHDNYSNQTSSNPAYNGGAVLDINEWIVQQGVQIGRNSSGLLTGNNALIFDPDAWDDFVPNPGSDVGFSSLWSTDIDLTGYDPATVQISFSYEFATLDDQLGEFSVIHTEGQLPAPLLQLDSNEHAASTILSGSPTYSAGTDFPVPTENSLTFQTQVLLAGNDWWMGVDNIQVTATPVPEPATIAISAIMLLLLGIEIAKRRMQRGFATQDSIPQHLKDPYKQCPPPSAHRRSEVT